MSLLACFEAWGLGKIFLSLTFQPLQVLDLLGEISMDTRKELEAAVKAEEAKDKAEAAKALAV